MTRLRISHLAVMAALVLAAGVPAAAVAAAPASASTATYTITDLGSLGGGVTDATAINATGQVTGYSTVTTGVSGEPGKPPSRAFLWSNGTMTDLGTLPKGGNSKGFEINSSGEVAGNAIDSGDFSQPTLWKGTTITALRIGAGPVRINDSGQYIWNCGAVCEVTDGTQTTLPTPSGLSLCSPVAISDNGEVLGNCVVTGPENDYQGVVWVNGTPTVLPTLGGSIATGGTLPMATAINNNGQVTGTAVTSTGALDGFLWSNGRITDLGPTFSPAAINDSGVIVGGQLIYSGGTLQNLNNLIPAGSGYQILSATGINDNGQIVANATDTATGQQHALLLTPS
jgi:probable HAF family extracellular repeat protein